MEQGSWLDYGMFLQNIMIAARARGLDTCPQAAFIQFHRVISRVLNLDQGEQVVCGMALGYADPDKTENSLVTEREPVSAFAQFIEETVTTKSATFMAVVADDGIGREAVPE